MEQLPLYTTRRDFLTGGLSLLSAAATLPVFLGRTATALAEQSTSRPRKDDSQRILVVIHLAGGNDDLNTVIPYSMDPYYRYRRQLAIAEKDVLRLERGVGLHPAATGLKELYDEGRLAIVQGVGYPNPNRSHFSSTDIWHSADPNLRTHSGWLGRYFDATCGGSDPGPDPLLGVSLTKEVPLALQGDNFAPLAFENPDALTWRAGQSDSEAAAVFRSLNESTETLSAEREPAEPTLPAFLQRAALNARMGADHIRAATGRRLRARRRGQGGQLSQSLDLVAAMIAADLPTRVYYVSMGGFDTHTGQLGRHQQLLGQLGDALRDFLDTLGEHKLLDRVLVMTFSEFGRRVQENASGGTDHGEAAPLFLCGSNVRPGLYEEHPDMTKLHRGDLAFTCDFRRVYATVLQHWLGVSPQKLLRGNFPLLRVIRK